MINHRRFVLALVTVLFVSTASATAGGPAGRPKEGSVKRSARTVYIVELSDPPLARYGGGLPGLQPTSPQARGQRKLDPQSPESRRYAAHLLARQGEVLAAIGRSLGREPVARDRYALAFNGMALDLTAAEARDVARLPGVLRVEPNRNLRPLTDAGPSWIGAPGIWDGTATGGLPGTQGEGIVVGVIDTGVNMDHPSFADVGGDGYDHTNPRGAGNYAGWCNPASPDFDPTLACNDKLIGVWSHPDSDGDVEDDHGHGSHTASTVAGNHTTAPFGGFSLPISGVAPHANLISYDACDLFGGCFFSSLLAAIDQAVADGVDVINFSIGGFAFDDPWSDVLTTAFLGARAAGVFVAAAAGNSGPSSFTIGTPAIAPWLLTVGAATHDRVIGSTLATMSGGATAPPPDLHGKGLTGGFGPAAIVRAANFGSRWCDTPFPAGSFSGQIVVCDQDFFQTAQTMGQNVLAAGGGGLVIANDFFGDPTFAENNVLPAVHIDAAKGNQLRSWLATGAGHTGTLTGAGVGSDPAAADVLAWFSSRGPTPQVPDVVKPDLVAPGVEILAASRDPNDFATLSGTSMASPHAAGAAALLIALHPGWTPAEVQAALMTTALTTGLKREDGVTPAGSPFDRGAGRVDLGAAARAGLVLDVPPGAFAAADPALGGDPTTLNLPALGDASCILDCSWTRTVRSTLAVASQWTVSASLPAGTSLSVSPHTFQLAPGATQPLQVTITNDTGLDGWTTGSLTLTEAGALAPAAHLPFAVRWVAQHQLAVTKAGTGSGRVVSNPPGIDCGGDCAEEFIEGTFVTLTATPDPGHAFVGWTGACFGAGPDCNVSIFSDQVAVAFFNPQPPDRALANQVPVKDSINGPVSEGSWKYFFADLGAGNGELVVDLFDLTGDVTLFVRRDAKPTWSNAHCVDWNFGAPNRRCVITFPQAGRWWIGVNNEDVGPIEYSVRASWGSPGVDRALANGVPVGDFVSSPAPGGGWRYYSIDIAGPDDLLVELRDLSADADLFVRFNAKPDRSNYDCVSANPATEPDQCLIAAPTPGRWWVGVNNFSAGTVTYTVEASWGPPPATDLYTLTPCRVLDTRVSGQPLVHGVSRLLAITGACGIPATAQAVSFNLTVVQPSGNGNILLHPGGTPPPLASSINFGVGQTRANNAILRLSFDGTGTLAALATIAGGGQVHLILDVNGYFE